MTRPMRPSLAVKITRLCIWSVRNQSWLAGQIRIYVLMASAIIAFLALARVITLQTAMLASCGIGLFSAGMIWTLVHQRKSWLLNLREPELRAQAFEAMHAYLYEVQGLHKAARQNHALPKEESENRVDCSMS